MQVPARPSWSRNRLRRSVRQLLDQAARDRAIATVTTAAPPRFSSRAEAWRRAGRGWRRHRPALISSPVAAKIARDLAQVRP